MLNANAINKTRAGHPAIVNVHHARRPDPAALHEGRAALGEDAWSREAEQELSFAYDALGRVTREQGEQGEQGELVWQYDAQGNCTALRLPDGRTLKQHYYGSGHLLGIALDGLPVTDFTRDELHREVSRTQGPLTTRSGYDRPGRLHRRDVFTGSAQRPAPRRWSRRWDYDYRNNPVREERDDDPFSGYHWQYDSAGRLLSQDGTLPGREQWRWDAAGNPLDAKATEAVHANRVTQLNGIQWRYDIHGRTVEKDDGQTRWHYRYDGEHRLAEVTSRPRDRTRPQVAVSFRYDPLGRRISKTCRRTLAGQPHGREVTTRFIWEGLRLLQEIRDAVPLTYVYSDQHSHEPLARIDGVNTPDIYWFHNQPNGTPERLTDAEGRVCQEAQNSAWGKLLHERDVELPYAQNLRMQGQYLDRETGLHYNLFRYYDPDCGRFTQQDPIGLAGGLNLYQYAPNPLGWVDPLGLCKGKISGEYSAINPGPLSDDLAGTFAGGKYRRIILSQDTELYRAGVEGHPFGRFFSLDKPQSVLQTRIDKAVLPNWPGGGSSPLDTVFKFKVPTGTKIYVGEVGYQHGIYLGGTQQILIPEPWDIPGVQVLGQEPLL